MTGKIIKTVYALFCLAILFYVSLPNYDFPKPPPDSVQSNEPADTETPLRRAYFTNYSRAEVLEWYKSQFDFSTFLNVRMPTYLLNYPPEEAGSIIRDQTRSTFLQEIVHPFRENLFINGFEPAANDNSNRIVINGTHWRQKIIIRYVPSNFWLRFLISILTLIAVSILYKTFKSELKSLNKYSKKNH